MGGEVLKDILIGRTATGNAAPGAVSGNRTITNAAPGIKRDTEPTLPYVTSYLEAPEDVAEPEPEAPPEYPSPKYHRDPEGGKMVTLNGVDYHFRNPGEREAFNTEYQRAITVYTKYQQAQQQAKIDAIVAGQKSGTDWWTDWNKPEGASTVVTSTEKSLAVVKPGAIKETPGWALPIDTRSLGSSEAQAIALASGLVTERRGRQSSKLVVQPDLESIPSGSARVVYIHRVPGTSSAPAHPVGETRDVVTIGSGKTIKSFDLGDPAQLQSFMDYWKAHPIDEKLSVQVVEDSKRSNYNTGKMEGDFSHIPNDQLKMYAFWMNPVKEYDDQSFDFSTEQGRASWKSYKETKEAQMAAAQAAIPRGPVEGAVFAPSAPRIQEPDEWYTYPGIYDGSSTPRPGGPYHFPENKVSWDILKGTRLEGAIPMSYQVYQSLNKAVDQAKEYAVQKAAYEAAKTNQGKVKYKLPEGPVNKYFNIQGEALRDIAGGNRSFGQGYTQAALTRMGERVAVGDMSPLARAIYLVLKNNKGITTSDLADAFGVTETDVTEAMVLVDKFSQGLAAKANVKTA